MPHPDLRQLHQVGRIGFHLPVDVAKESFRGSARWRAVRALIDGHAPRRTEHDRIIAAANIRYYLAATTWHYYRFYLDFSLQLTIECAQSAVRLVVNDIAKR